MNEKTGVYGSDTEDHGMVRVYFGNEYNHEAYYAHSISEIGSPDDSESGYSMWSWINHLRHKTWWNPSLEEDFIAEVKKHI